MSRKRRRWLVPGPGTPPPAQPESRAATPRPRGAEPWPEDASTPAAEQPPAFASPPATVPKPAAATAPPGYSTASDGGSLLFDAPEAPRPAPMPPGPPTTRSPGPVRWATLAVIVVAAGLGLAAGGRECAGFADGADAGSAIVSGVLACAIWTAVIATVVWGVRRARNRPSPWHRALLSVATIAISAAFLLLGVAGRAVERGDRCGATGAEVPSARAQTRSGETLTDGQRVVVTYINGFIRCTEGVAGNRVREKRFLAALKKGRFTRASLYADRQQHALVRYRECLRGLVPTDDGELAGPTSRSAESIGLMVRAWDDYRRGSDRPSLAFLKRGDRRARLAQRRSRAAATETERI
jgi:hypothetical protein